MANKFPTSEAIVNYLVTQGNTQQQLAKVLKVDRSYISHVSKGERNFTLDHLEKLAKAFSMTVPELYVKAIPVNSLPKKLREGYGYFLSAMQQTDTCLRQLRESRSKRKRKATA